MTAVLSVDDVSLTFGEGSGIRNVSFDVADRAVTAVIGPNGAGKTVLFSVMAGLARADSGTLTMAREGVTVAFCPDVPRFEPWLTAAEVVGLSLDVTSRRPEARRRRALIAAALEECGLGAVAERRIAVFSRGMLQRLGIAAAVVAEPDVLILDEPHSALDPLGRAAVREIIVRQGRQRAVILSSHLLSEVERTADDIVILDQGRVIAVGTTSEIVAASTEPRWTVRLARPSTRAPRDLAATVPGAVFASLNALSWSVEMADAESAADLLVDALRAFDAPVVSVARADGDLDDAFARLIGGGARRMTTVRTFSVPAALGVVGASTRVEWSRLARSGLLVGVVGVFVFFGLSAPVLSLHLGEILRSAANSPQLTIEAAQASPADALALFSQSAMQLGLILAVAVAITSLGWDAHPGSSIFYRTRVRRLSLVTLPRLIVGIVVVSVGYLVALALAAWLTWVVVGPLSWGTLAAMGASCVVYLAMAMCIGWSIMAAARRTIVALTAGSIVMLVAPLLNTFEGARGWAPTALLIPSPGGVAIGPMLSSVVVAGVCVALGSIRLGRARVHRGD